MRRLLKTFRLCIMCLATENPSFSLMYLPIFKPLIVISMNVVQDLSNIDFVKAPLDSKLFQDNNTTAPETRRAFLSSLWGRTC